MAAFSSPAKIECKDDFDSICASYTPFKYFEDYGRARPLLRLAHRFALHLSQISHGVSARPEHQRIFLEEARSDAVHLVHMLFSGDARAVNFYMRSIVENFWRHLYFKDHPVEYAWLHERPGYFLTIESLRDYCKNTKLTAGELRDYAGNCANFFAATSGVVHSTVANRLVLRENIASIRLSLDEISSIFSIISNLSKDVLLLLAVCESCLFDAMSGARRAHYLEFLDAKRKSARQASLGVV